MANVEELIEKRARLWDNTKKFLDEHTDAEGKISDEDATTYRRRAVKAPCFSCGDETA